MRGEEGEGDECMAGSKGNGEANGNYWTGKEEEEEGLLSGCSWQLPVVGLLGRTGWSIKPGVFGVTTSCEEQLTAAVSIILCYGSLMRISVGKWTREGGRD